jgi:hypothetical protein
VADREPLERAENRARKPHNAPVRSVTGLVRVLGGLLAAAKRRMMDVQSPAYGESPMYATVSPA